MRNHGRPGTRREVVTRLATGARKSDRGAGGYSRWVNRPFGRQLAALAYLGGLTPNQVSIISAACTYAALALVPTVRPSWPIAVVIAALLVIGYALDSADGQVARLTGLGSPAGEWLDHVFDALKISAFHLVIAICWFRFYDLGHAGLLLIPLGYSFVATAFYFAITLSDMLRRVARLKDGEPDAATASVDPNEAAPVLRSLIVLPNDYGLLALAMVLLPLHRTFEVVYTVLFAANAFFLLAGCVRWYREMSGLRRRPAATA